MEQLWLRSISLNFVIAFVLMAIPSTTHSLSAKREIHSHLARYMGFSAKELLSLEKGRAIVKNLETPEKKEVAVLGAVTVAAHSSCFIERFRKIEQFKKSKMVLQIGKFSNPPILSDLNRLTLSDEELVSLKKCKIGNCKMKLSEDWIKRFHKEIQWSESNAEKRATNLFRELLLQYVHEYLKNGKFLDYRDKKKVFNSASGFSDLLKQSSYYRERDQDLYEYLLRFPATGLHDTENFFYWSKEEFGLKPVITVTHVTIYRKATPSFTGYFIASKQIYANHYFLGSLGWTEVWEELDSSEHSRFYLMYLNRSRSDMLGGLLGGLKRSIVRKKSKTGLLQNLEAVQSRMVRECQSQPLP